MPVALSSIKLPVVVLIVLSSNTAIVMLPNSALGATNVPLTIKSPVTSKSLLTVVVPEPAPMLIEVALAPMPILVAFKGKKLNELQLVKIAQPFTVSVPRTITLPELSGIGVPASPYRLVLFVLLEFCVLVEPYRLELLVMLDPYLIEYWRYCLGCHTLVKRVCPPDHLPKLF